MAGSTRKSTSMTLDRALLDEARELGINISKAAEEGVSTAVRHERGRRWREENAGAIADYNAFIETHGVPLAGHRKF